MEIRADLPPAPPLRSATATATSMATAGAAGAPKDARGVAVEFEAMMVGEMLESMFAGLKTDGPFGGGASEATWRGFMLREYGQAIARSGTLGIARLVHEQVARLYGDTQTMESAR